ncbi:MAG TPA: hypothetical protein VNZ22_23205 [Bacillota bacterium]|nr:hypothetical protein [Bacillota bacterium]
MLKRLPLNPAHKRFQALPPLTASDPNSLLGALSRVVVPPIHRPGTHLGTRRRLGFERPGPMPQLPPQTASAI